MNKKTTINISVKNLRDYAQYANAEKKEGNQPKSLSQIIRECLDRYFSPVAE